MNNNSLKNSENDKMARLLIQFEKLELEHDYITDPLDNETDEKPNIASAGPYRVHLDKDRNYFYCTCGKSKAQPFCDGSHQGTSYKPLKFSIKHNVTWSLLCGCKMNDITSGPYCDGSHVSIEW